MSEIRTFYLDRKVSIGDIVQISGNDYHHIRNVLRLKEGESILLLTCDGKHQAKIIIFNSDLVVVQITGTQESKIRFPLIHLIQGIPKGWKMDEIIEKSTEMGVSAIYPAYMTRSIPKFSAEEEQNKRKRWEKIAISATKQSRRNNIPIIGQILSFEKQLNNFREFLGGKILFWELSSNQSLLKFIQNNKMNEYLIVIGPEGGISHDEADKCTNSGFSPLSLGDTILRTETASPYAVSLIRYLWQSI
jgi:16S rRNA (uracil1498-N3)-methyltransferase